MITKFVTENIFLIAIAFVSGDGGATFLPMARDADMSLFI